MKENKGQNSKEIRKQAQWAKVTGLMANMPMKITRGKEEINGPRKSK